MPTFVNLVATSCKNGDPTALLHWYHDHVHILMQFDGLHRATLYRRADHPGSSNTAATAAPEYICLYDFASQADFMAFETSNAREQARQILLAGWGKNGIEITMRKQFWRLGSRLTDNAVAASHGLWQIQSLQLGAGPAAGVARWLNDRLHRALDTSAQHHSGHVSHVSHLAWHRAVDATDAGGDALVVAQTDISRASAPSASPSILPPGWWLGDANEADEADDAGHGAWAHAPATAAIAWQAGYRRLCVWGR